jgi:hypothetical protein
MAFSSSKVGDNVNGKYKELYFDADFASVTLGHIKTGLSTIIFAEHLNNTTENDGKLAINKASDGSTAEQGGLYCSGFTSNDTARIKVTGY